MFSQTTAPPARFNSLNTAQMAARKPLLAAIHHSELSERDVFDATLAHSKVKKYALSINSLF